MTFHNEERAVLISNEVAEQTPWEDTKARESFNAQGTEDSEEVVEYVKLPLTDAEKDKYAREDESLVFYVVKMFENSGVDYDELVSIAMVGFAKALHAFDKNRLVKFSTYSINCIRNEILFFLRKERNHVKNSISMNCVLSVDKNGNSLSLEDTVSTLDKDERSVEDNIVLSDEIKLLRSALSDLSDKEQYIITYRYGLDRGITKTQREIADTIGMSQANVSKIEKNILDKVKKILKDRYHMTEELFAS
ncbi:RNA polymerase sporulation-specific sigma factor [Paenibacillus sp. 1182]|uniref:sigma-70 family RNA polymerase sigma factor n=1 Tax=Paenibacillus sp. 1182 TaxID=2806565 RepID=UPI001AE50C95|nr:sigma-70 family RNA polymerase sigma factor [Paenibacillus sp. 1182]MBP1308775.1 RNA polymerase sporulation-specific sigma factor [Paenibacillus sp. 1182]